jgi:hypothetical protein
VTDLAGMLAAAAECPAELFRPYRYRDPARADEERMAVLRRIDLEECAGCRERWPCADHQPRGPVIRAAS